LQLPSGFCYKKDDTDSALIGSVGVAGVVSLIFISWTACSTYFVFALSSRIAIAMNVVTAVATLMVFNTSKILIEK